MKTALSMLPENMSIIRKYGSVALGLIKILALVLN